MRKALKNNEGIRGTFSATFVRMGSKVNYKGYSEETILLRDVREKGAVDIVADHLWFSYTKGFQALKLTEGAKIEFDARVKQYSKGYVNNKYGINKRKLDYKLSHPTRIKIAG